MTALAELCRQTVLGSWWLVCPASSPPDWDRLICNMEIRAAVLAYVVEQQAADEAWRAKRKCRRAR